MSVATKGFSLREPATMETERRLLDVHVHALEGFPDDHDVTFDRLYAIVEVIVRLVPRDDPATEVRFHSFRRSLADFVHFEKQMKLEGEQSAHVANVAGISASIERFEIGLDRPRFGSVAKEIDRLVVLLETALTHVLKEEMGCSAAVKQFFGRELVATEELQQLVARCLSWTNPSIEETLVVGGGRYQHEVRVDGESLLLWKFQLAADAVDLSAVFTSCESENEVQTEEVDPYSQAAWNSEMPSSTVDEDKLVLQYTTRYAKRPGHEDMWIYGAVRIPSDAHGVVTLEWIDAGEASIDSKTLRFQTAVCRTGGALHHEYTALLYQSTDVICREKVESLGWLEAIVAGTSVTTWPTTGNHLEEPLEVDHDPPTHVALPIEISRQPQLQIRDLESKVFRLEEELQGVRQELKTMKSELEISSEIYKASLETIAQLEAVRHQPVVNASQLETTDDLASRDSSGWDHVSNPDSYDQGDDEVDLDEDGADEEPTDSETNRLRDLVATFQEQCLWRSIETSESEKRNLLLEAELKQLDQVKQFLATQLAARDQEVATLQAENQKLKAHKAVLVKEVKKLQPYSQVNLSALIREAEEARMMQRSLQAQLQALVGGTTPETEHPIVQPPAEG